jgi:peptidoglycan/LPS O-acetylase OafA/YrhL
MASSIAWPSVRLERLSLPQGSLPGPPLEDRIDSLESARVQTLRGLACLLLVAFHTIGSTAASGLHVPDDSRYRVFTNLFVHLRMPLFTFLSGLVYAYRPLGSGQALPFSGKKVRRLGVPLVVASTVLYGLHWAMHHQVPPLSQMWSIYLFPYWHLWFVQALLLVFAALIVLESLEALSTFRRFTMVFALSLVLYWYGPFEQHNVLGLQNATYLLPFFLWGLGAHRYRGLLQTRRALIATAVCFIVTQGFHSYIVLTRALAPIDPVATRSALHLLVGMSASLCALQLLPRLRLMEQIGGSSYPIYLYHPLFVAAVVSGAGAQLTLPTGLLFVGAGAAGIVGPMVLQLAARQSPFGQLLLEGRWRPLPSAGTRLSPHVSPVAIASANRPVRVDAA